MNHHVRLGHQLAQSVSASFRAQIEAGPALAENDVGYDGWLLPAGRVYPQDIGAVAGQAPGCDRTCDAAGKVQDPGTCKRPLGSDVEVLLRLVRPVRYVDKFFALSGASLRVVNPRRTRSHPSRCSAVLQDG